MEQLNITTLKKGGFPQDLEIGLHNFNEQPQQSQQIRQNRKEKILQFGEGNFLRSFVDYFIDILNEKNLFDGNIVVVQPIDKGLTDLLNQQDGLYTVLLRGLENQTKTVQKRLITSITSGINPYSDFVNYKKLAQNPDLRFVISNTTEAGITFVETDKITDTPPSSFPAKITALLHERYTHFGGDVSKGFIFIPCELIDNSGDKLKEIVQMYAKKWQLSADFLDWLEKACYFANTLVDRIVTGYPKDEISEISQNLGYSDNLLSTAEIFHFFAIEAKGWAAAEINKILPFAKANINAIVTENVTPYKLRKVRILNGAHTMSVLAAFLCGKKTVKEMMDDPLFAKYLETGIFTEIIPSLDMDENELKSFAKSVADRFSNPYIKHYLTSIALNSVAKYKARVLPSILEYQKRKGSLPPVLTASFAALLAFYKGENHEVPDDAEIVSFFAEQWAKGDISALVTAVCARADYWGQDLNKLPSFTEKITTLLQLFETSGMKAVIEETLKNQQ
ncbi:MAG: tagaturonate reductase [Defluviitaleaceae bacterium]|nr:tagaturonate reductase [Defluviitaleaceae bacterium]